MPMNAVALITGVSRKEGLGYEVAVQLKQKGYLVIISARDSSTAEKLANSIGVDWITLDISIESSIKLAAEEIKTRFGKLDAP